MVRRPQAAGGSVSFCPRASHRPETLHPLRGNSRPLHNPYIPLDDALRIVSEQFGRTRMRPVIMSLLEAVLDGAHLSDAMARHPEAFQDEYVNMARAGEASGDMARVFGELADLLERRLEQLAGRLTSALVYPCVLMVAALVSIAIIMGVLVPNLSHPSSPRAGDRCPRRSP